MGLIERLGERKGLTTNPVKLPGDYHLLGFRQPSDAEDPYYPSVDSSFNVILQESDGRYRDKLYTSAMAWRMEYAGEKDLILKQLDHGMVYLTDHRVIIDFGARHERGRQVRAIVGHIYYAWLREVMYHCEQRQIRFLVSSKYKNGTSCDWFVDVELLPERNEDVRAAVRSIVSLASAWWLNNDMSLTEDQRRKFEALVDIDLTNPGTSNKLARVQMPVYYSPNRENYGPKLSK